MDTFKQLLIAMLLLAGVASTMDAALDYDKLNRMVDVIEHRNKQANKPQQEQQAQEKKSAQLKKVLAHEIEEYKKKHVRDWAILGKYGDEYNGDWYNDFAGMETKKVDANDYCMFCNTPFGDSYVYSKDGVQLYMVGVEKDEEENEKLDHKPIRLTPGTAFYGNGVNESCGHKVHEKCVKGWLTESNTCPICRRPFNLYKLKEVQDTGVLMGGLKLLLNFVKKSEKTEENQWIFTVAEKVAKNLSESQDTNVQMNELGLLLDVVSLCMDVYSTSEPGQKLLQNLLGGMKNAVEKLSWDLLDVNEQQQFLDRFQIFVKACGSDKASKVYASMLPVVGCVAKKLGLTDNADAKVQMKILVLLFGLVAQAIEENDQAELYQAVESNGIADLVRGGLLNIFAAAAQVAKNLSGRLGAQIDLQKEFLALLKNGFFECHHNKSSKGCLLMLLVVAQAAKTLGLPDNADAKVQMEILTLSLSLLTKITSDIEEYKDGLAYDKREEFGKLVKERLQTMFQLARQVGNKLSARLDADVQWELLQQLQGLIVDYSGGAQEPYQLMLELVIDRVAEKLKKSLSPDDQWKLLIILKNLLTSKCVVPGDYQSLFNAALVLAESLSKQVDFNGQLGLLGVLGVLLKSKSADTKRNYEQIFTLATLLADKLSKSQQKEQEKILKELLGWITICSEKSSKGNHQKMLDFATTVADRVVTSLATKSKTGATLGVDAQNTYFALFLDFITKCSANSKRKEYQDVLEATKMMAKQLGKTLRAVPKEAFVLLSSLVQKDNTCQDVLNIARTVLQSLSENKDWSVSNQFQGLLNQLLKKMIKRQNVFEAAQQVEYMLSSKGDQQVLFVAVEQLQEMVEAFAVEKDDYKKMLESVELVAGQLDVNKYTNQSLALRKSILTFWQKAVAQNNDFYADAVIAAGNYMNKENFDALNLWISLVTVGLKNDDYLKAIDAFKQGFRDRRSADLLGALLEKDSEHKNKIVKEVLRLALDCLKTKDNCLMHIWEKLFDKCDSQLKIDIGRAALKAAKEGIGSDNIYYKKGALNLLRVVFEYCNEQTLEDDIVEMAVEAAGKGMESPDSYYAAVCLWILLVDASKRIIKNQKADFIDSFYANAIKAAKIGIFSTVLYSQVEALWLNLFKLGRGFNEVVAIAQELEDKGDDQKARFLDLLGILFWDTYWKDDFSSGIMTAVKACKNSTNQRVHEQADGLLSKLIGKLKGLINSGAQAAYYYTLGIEAAKIGIVHPVMWQVAIGLWHELFVFGEKNGYIKDVRRAADEVIKANKELLNRYSSPGQELMGYLD